MVLLASARSRLFKSLVFFVRWRVGCFVSAAIGICSFVLICFFPSFLFAEEIGQQEEKKNEFQLLPKDVFFQPGGGFRLRYDYLRGASDDLLKNRKSSQMSHRAQIDMKLHKGEFLETRFQWIHYSDWWTGSPFPENKGVTSANNGLIINQAWALWKVDDSVGLRLGRMPLHLGLGYTYGTNDWFNVPYSFDLVDLFWDWESVKFSFIAARTAHWGKQASSSKEGSHLIASLDIQSLVGGLDILNLNFVQFNRDASSSDEQDLFLNGLNLQRFSLETEMKGRRIFGSVYFTYATGEEQVVQANPTASEGKRDLSQSAFDLKLGYRFPGARNLQLWGGYHYDTGDESSEDNNTQSFDSFFYEVYGQSGLMDFIRWGNLSFFRAGMDMNLGDSWTLGAQWFGFSKTESGDRVHFGPIGESLNKGLETGELQLGSSNAIGNEFDVFTELEFSSGVRLRSTVSAFFPGEGIKSPLVSSSAIYQWLIQIGYFF